MSNVIVYWVTIPEDPPSKRMEELSSVVDGFGCGPVELWSAADPGSIHGQFADYLNSYSKALTYAHHQIWTTVVEKNLDYVLVLEDNIRIHKESVADVKEFLHHHIVSLDPEWDAVFLNASERVTPSGEWVKANNQCLSGAYVLSKRGAEFLINSFPKQNTMYMADWMTQVLQQRQHSYTRFPWPVIMDLDLPTSFPRFEKDQEKPIMEKVSKLLKESNLTISDYV